MKLRLLLGLISCALTASAIPVNYSGTFYDVTAENLTFNGSASLLESQPWFGSEAVAWYFANSVGYSLGGQTAGNPYAPSSYGPFFAFDSTPFIETVIFPGFTLPIGYGGYGDSVLTYAVATAQASAVPDGGTIAAMLGSAFLGLAALRCRFSRT